MAKKNLHCFFLVIFTLIVGFSQIGYLFTKRLWPDEALYAWYSSQIHNDPTFIFSKYLPYPPLFPILISFGQLFLPGEAGYRFLGLFFSLLGIIAIFHLGRKIQGYPLAIWGAWLLASNPNYYFYATSILIDIPLTVGHVILTILLFNINSSSRTRDHVFVGICGAILIFLKFSAIMTIPWILIYYLLTLNELKPIQRLQKALIPISICLASFLIFILKNYVLIGRFFYKLTTFKGTVIWGPFWAYLTAGHMIIPIFFTPLFIWGAYQILKERGKTGVLLLSCLLPMFIMVSLVPEKNERYLLPIMPAAVLITGIGINAFIASFRNKAKFIIIAVILASLSEIIYIRDELTIYNRQYIGFADAGSWIKKIDTKEYLILAGSPEALRYYADIPADQNVRRIPKKKKSFEAIIKNHSGPVILEIDCWEFTEPRWVHKATTLKYLQSLGFKKLGAVKWHPQKKSTKVMMDIVVLIRP